MTRKLLFSWPVILLTLCLRPLCPALAQQGSQPEPRQFSPDEVALINEARELSAEVIKLLNQGKYAEAEPLARKALDIRRKLFGEDDPATGQSLHNLGHVYRLLDRLKDAEPMLQRALKVREKYEGKDHLTVAHILHGLGLIHEQWAKYKQAEAYFERNLQIMEGKHGPDHIEVAVAAERLGTVYFRQGHYDKAESLSKRALTIREKLLGNDHLSLTGPLYNLIRIRREQGRFEEAVAYCQRTVQINESKLGPDHPQLANFLHELASLYDPMGRFQESEILHKRALKIRETKLGPNHPYVAQSLNSLGLLYGSVGRGEEAESLYERSLKIRNLELAKNPDDVTTLRSIAALYVNLGALYSDRGRFQEANEAQSRGLSMYEAIVQKHPDDARAQIEVAMSQNNIAVSFKGQGLYREAELYYKRSLETKEQLQGPDHPDTAIAVNNLAGLYMVRGQYDKAWPLYERARTSFATKYGPDHYLVAGCLIRMAQIKQVHGQSRQALALYEQSLQIQQANVHKVFVVSSERDMFALFHNDGGPLPRLVTMAAASEQEAVAPAFTWTLRRQGVVFDTLVRFRQAQSLLSPSDPLAPKVARYREVQKLLSDTALNPPRGVSPEKFAEQRKSWQKEADLLQAELNRGLAERHPDQITPDTTMDVASVQKRLPKDSALVYLVNFHGHDFKATGKMPLFLPLRYYAFVLTPGNSAPHLIELGPCDVIDKAVAGLRSHFDKGQGLDANTEEAGEREYRAAAKALYDMVFAKVRPKLGTASLIYLAAQGDLASVPFEALVDEQGKYLIENYRFAYQSVVRDMLRAKPAQPGKGTVVFAGPDYDMTAAQRREKLKGLEIARAPTDSRRLPNSDDETWTRSGRWRTLKGATAEAEDLRRALAKSVFGPVQIFSGADALEENFKRVKSPRILHVATHGFYLAETKNKDAPEGTAEIGFGAARGMSHLRKSDNPLLRSGVILAGANMLGETDRLDMDDGWVTAAEIAFMDLRGTELVVLSACETGLGKELNWGEGPYGLRRAFLYAGAQSLVTSLFVVPDIQTRELMKQFYGNLQKGQGKLAALHSAQIEMIRQRRQMNGAAHPFFWASFVLVGDPS